MMSLVRKIRPVDSTSLVEEVELQLMRFLMRSELKAGDALPKEVELAEAFGVSRTVVREALTRLKAMGMVESVRHKGAVVRHPDVLTALERVLHPRILDDDTLRDIFEIRLVLEIGMADLLFARITPADVAELEEIVSGQTEQPGTMFDSSFEVRFHGKLYAISGNRTLQGFQELLLPIFAYVHEQGMVRNIKRGRRFVSHAELVKILKTGTAEQFREAMRLHLDNQFKRIL